jgi:hypothetical protein
VEHVAGNIMTQADIDAARAECQEALDALRAAENGRHIDNHLVLSPADRKVLYDRAYAKVGRYITEYQIHHSPPFLLKLLAHAVKPCPGFVDHIWGNGDKGEVECGSCEAIAILLKEARLG